MRLSHKVGKNTLLLSVGYLLGRLLAFLVFRRLTHLEGTEGAGVWGVAVELTGILVVVAGFGLDSLITREIIKTPGQRASLFFASLRLRLMTGALGYLGLLVFVHFAGYDSLTQKAVLIMALGVFLEIWAMAADSVFQAREKVQLQTMSQILAALLYFSLAWFWLDQGWGLMGIVWASLASRGLRLGVVLVLVFPLLRSPQSTPKAPSVSLRWLARLALPVFIASTIGILAFKIDTIMVMSFLGKAETGVYTAGRRLLDLTILVPHLFALAVFPSLQRRRQEAGPNLDSLQPMAVKTLRWVLLAAIPLAAGAILAAEPMIHLLISGQGFAESIPVLRIVMLGLPLISASFVGNRLLLTLGAESRLVWISSAALLVNVGLNIALLPILGARGAAISSVLSLLAAWLVYWRVLTLAGLHLQFIRSMLLALVATLCSWLPAMLILRSIFPQWGLQWYCAPANNLVALGWTALLVGLFYGVFIFFFGGFRHRDQKIQSG